MTELPEDTPTHQPPPPEPPEGKQDKDETSKPEKDKHPEDD